MSFKSDSPSQHLIGDQIEPFLRHLRDAGYAERTLFKKRTVAKAFVRWATFNRITIDDLNQNHVAPFVARPPRRRKAHVKFELAVMRPFLQYLCAAGGLQRQSPHDLPSVGGGLLQQYENHLRKNRWLAENSVRVYVPLIRDFLASQPTATIRSFPGSIDTLAIRDFVLKQTRNRSAEYIRLLATALRSFLRFLFLSGQMPRDLSPSVPRVCKYRQSVPPAFLSPEQVTRVLTATNRSKPRGRRDYAILLLLARLGLRAGEIVTLELGDIRWRSAEIVVHGKGGVVEHLPLLDDIGRALADYLRQDRGRSASRKIFLRMLAPHAGLAGPAAVGHIVRLALARAGVRRSGRGAAHLFRHGLGTKMIRHGASLSQIAEVLRHRSQMTTSAYAQVAFDALRGVAQPWPRIGGAR